SNRCQVQRLEAGVAMPVSVGDLIQRTCKQWPAQHGEDPLTMLGLVPEWRSTQEAEHRLTPARDLRQWTDAETYEKYASLELDSSDLTIGAAKRLFERPKVGFDELPSTQFVKREEPPSIVH